VIALPEEVRKAEETLRVALTITGQPELVYTSALSKANRDALRALATLTEHLERLERERMIIDAARFELARVSDVRVSRIDIIGNTDLILQSAGEDAR